MTPDMPMLYRQYDEMSDAIKDFEMFAMADDSMTSYLDTLISAFDSRLLTLKVEQLSDVNNTYHIMVMETITHSV